MSIDASTDSVYLTLTSDACREIFPNNSPSDFSIQLGQQTVLDTNSWEVGLYSIAYPYEFNTVGPDCYLYVKYKHFSSKIHLPEWHCTNINSLCELLTVEMNKAILGVINNVFKEEFKALYKKEYISKDPINHQSYTVVKVSADSANRVTFYFDSRFSDLGLSERMMQILGFSKQHSLSEENFLKRQSFISAIEDECSNKEINFATIADLEKGVRLSAGYSVSAQFEKDIQNRTGCSGSNLYDIITSGGDHPPDIKLLFPDDHGEFRRHLRDVENKANLPISGRAIFNDDDSVKSVSALHKRALITFAYCKLLECFHINNHGTFKAENAAVVNPYELMYIYSDLIKPQPFDNFSSPLLDILKTEGKQGELTEFRSNGNIQYKSLNRSNITTIKTYIASDLAKPFPFLRGPLVIRLHFRKRSRHF